jgi:hypothetical protein
LQKIEEKGKKKKDLWQKLSRGYYTKRATSEDANAQGPTSVVADNAKDPIKRFS